MKRAPQWFTRALEILDPLLRVRWSDVSAKWVIDRRAVLTQEEMRGLEKRESGLRLAMNNIPSDAPENRIHELRIKWMDVKDEYDSAREVRRVVMKPDVLTEKTYHMLCRSDIVGYGGYARFADDLEASEDKARADSERVWDNKCDARDKEANSMLEFVLRKKQVLLNERCMDMRRLLHGVHSKPTDGPLIQVTDF